MKTGFYVEQGPQVGLPGFVYDLLWLLYGVVYYTGVCIQLYEVATHPVVLPLLALFNKYNPASALTRGYPAQHSHSFKLVDFLSHPFTPVRREGSGLLKNTCARQHFGVKGIAGHQAHVTLLTSKLSLKLQQISPELWPQLRRGHPKVNPHKSAISLPHTLPTHTNVINSPLLQLTFQLGQGGKLGPQLIKSCAEGAGHHSPERRPRSGSSGGLQVRGEVAPPKSPP